jgi:hypothetical protein
MWRPTLVTSAVWGLEEPYDDPRSLLSPPTTAWTTKKACPISVVATTSDAPSDHYSPIYLPIAEAITDVIKEAINVVIIGARVGTQSDLFTAYTAGPITVTFSEAGTLPLEITLEKTPDGMSTQIKSLVVGGLAWWTYLTIGMILHTVQGEPASHTDTLDQIQEVGGPLSLTFLRT